MSALTTHLRKKFKSPAAALKQLGIDEAVLNQETRIMKGKPTVFAARALMMTAANIAPFLAQDATLNLLPVFKPLRAAEPFDKAKFQGALDAALDGKLAAKAKVATNHIAELVNSLHLAADGKDESASEEQKKAMEASGKDTGTGFPKNALDSAKAMDWLKANDRKAYDAMVKACDMEPDEAEDEEEDAEDEAEESEEDNEEPKSAANRAPGDKRGGKDKKGGRDKAPGKDKGMGEDQVISKAAFDAAMKTQGVVLRKQITEEVNKQNRAKNVAVSLGEKKLGKFDHGAFDTAAEVKHAVLDALGNKEHKDITEEIALDAMINLYPDVGTMRPVERKAPGGRPMAMDAAAKTSLDEMLGADSGFKDIRVGV